MTREPSTPEQLEDAIVYAQGEFTAPCSWLNAREHGWPDDSEKDWGARVPAHIVIRAMADTSRQDGDTIGELRRRLTQLRDRCVLLQDAIRAAHTDDLDGLLSAGVPSPEPTPPLGSGPLSPSSTGESENAGERPQLSFPNHPPSSERGPRNG